MQKYVPISSVTKTITHENKKCCEERVTPSIIQMICAYVLVLFRQVASPEFN
jgi:hypothetical protein